MKNHTLGAGQFVEFIVPVRSSHNIHIYRCSLVSKHFSHCACFEQRGQGLVAILARNCAAKPSGLSISTSTTKKGSCRFSSYLAFIWQQCYDQPMLSFLYHCFNYLSLARSFRTNGIGKLKVTLIEGVDLISSDPNGEFDITVASIFAGIK